MKKENIKKYPIYYKDKEYEIRIESEKEYDAFYNNHIQDYINIYEIIKQKHHWFSKVSTYDKKYYNKVYQIPLNKIYELNPLLEIIKNDENYYIELFEQAFKYYIEPIKIKEKQLAALNNWNGIII